VKALDLRTCPVCGGQFLPSHHAKKTCSDPCKKEFIRIRDANYRRAAYIADPNINRKRHRRVLEKASAAPDSMVELLRKRADARGKSIRNRDADPVRRANYLQREQIRNAFRSEYRAQRKVIWKSLLSEQDREKWRRYDTEWKPR